MKRHIKNYLTGIGHDGMSFIPCEVCGGTGTDVHHVEPRSHFGSTRKHEQDAFENLVALCRECHDKAHGVDSRDMKDMLKQITKSR
jgi:5-methylcytosine-specific restriction endonuclease McrA